MTRTGIPVLMYHKVGAPLTRPRDTFLNVSPRDFARHMAVLHRLGYRARTFAEVVESLRSGKKLPQRTFAITFDDGYSCVGEVAAPILAYYSAPATVFVVTDATGRTNAWDAEHGHAVLPLMDWNTLDALRAAGWEMAGHTRTHAHLDTLNDEDALREICEGSAELEARFGAVPLTFCYPFGHFNPRTPRLVCQAGFLGACTTRSGIASGHHDPFLLPRVKVSYRDGVLGLLYRLLVRPALPNLRRRRRDMG